MIEPTESLEPLDASETAKDMIRQHLENGGTAMAALMVPVGAHVLILNKGEVSAFEVGIGEVLDKDPNDTLILMQNAITVNV